MATDRDAHDLDRAKYVKAVERALPELPVVNGSVTLETIWMETALPEDLLREILRQESLEMPPNVERIVTREGEVLQQRRSAGIDDTDRDELD